MSVHAGPNIVTDNLVVSIDVKNPNKLLGGVSFWFLAANIAHPTNQTEQDAVFSDLSAALVTGYHQGDLDWFEGQSSVGYFPQSDNYLWQGQGYVYVPISGTYTFAIDSDDAGDLFVNNVRVSDFYGGHAMTYDFSSTSINKTPIELTAGWYPIKARVQESAGGSGMSVGWIKPGSSTWEVIPEEYLRPLNTPPYNLINPSGYIVYDPLADVSAGYLNFNGTSDYATTFNAGYVDSTEGTVSAWVRFNTFMPAGDTNPVISYGGFESGAGWQLGYDAESEGIGLTTWRTSGDIQAGVGVEESQQYLDQWIYLTAVYTASAIKIYINDSLISSKSVTGTIVEAATFYLGSEEDRVGSHMFDGDIGPVQVYSRELSLDEIRQNFNATRSRYGI
jgi:hypothetical protein